MALGLAVARDVGTLLARVPRELAGTRLALTGEGASGTLERGIGGGIFALKSTIVGVVSSDTHVRLALTVPIGSTAVVAGKVVIGDVHAAESSCDREFAHVLIRRAATLTVRMLFEELQQFCPMNRCLQAKTLLQRPLPRGFYLSQ